jgi:hypothetical protein
VSALIKIKGVTIHILYACSSKKLIHQNCRSVAEVQHHLKNGKVEIVGYVFGGVVFGGVPLR